MKPEMRNAYLEMLGHDPLKLYILKLNKKSMNTSTTSEEGSASKERESTLLSNKNYRYELSYKGGNREHKEGEIREGYVNSSLLNDGI